MKTITFIISLTLFFSVFSLSAQPVNNVVKGVVMPAPNAASLGKYGDIPVSYFTGVPNIAVPIHTLEEGPLSLPISLSYHASGIKPGEPATWVGAGWTLHTGGIVTRTVAGVPDEDIGRIGYYYNGSALNLNQATLGEVANGSRDGEPDLFYFSCGGYSGKFLYDRSKKVRMIPKQDVKVEIVMTYGSIDGFIIIPPDGTRYVFGNTFTESTVFNDNTPTPSKNTWYLAKIESADKKYAINFNYVSEDYSFKSPAGCSFVLKSAAEPSGQPCSSSGTGIDCPTREVAATIKYDNNQVYGRRLSSISTSTTTITFIANTGREDLDPEINSTVLPKRLDEIQIQSGTFCSKMVLTYDYFQDSQSSSCTISPGSHCKKLQLKDVKKSSCDNTLSEEPYKFEYEGSLYNGKIFLANRLTKAVDHWGFSNGAVQNDTIWVNVPKTTLTFIVNGSPANFTYGEANRNTDETFMKKGVLKKLTYPTGGHTEFSYEANTHYDTSNYVYTRDYVFDLRHCLASTCCGYSNASSFFTFNNIVPTKDSFILHFSKDPSCGSQYGSVNIEVRDSLTNSLVGNYGFNLDFSPEQSRTIENRLDYISNLLQNGGKYKFTLFVNNGWGRFQIVRSNKIPAPNVMVGGLRVKEIRSHDGIAAANDIVKTYDYTQASNPSLTSGLQFTKPIYGYSFSQNSSFYVVWQPSSITSLTDFQGYHVGYSRVVENHNGNGKSIYTFETEYSPLPPNGNCLNYPCIPVLPKVKRGNLASDTKLSSSAQELSNLINYPKYELYDTIGGLMYRTTRILFTCDGLGTTSEVHWWPYTIYIPNTSVYRLDSVTQILDGVTTSTAYFYDPNNKHFAPTAVTMTNSDNKVTTTKHRYVFDWANSDLRTEMINRNMIGMPVETTVWVGNDSLSGTRTEYSFFDSNGSPTSTSTGNCPYPYRFYNFERTWTGGALQSGSWALQGTIDLYHPDSDPNAKGYPKQFTKTNWLPETYEWNKGLITKRTYSNFIWRYRYYPGTRLLSGITHIDGQRDSFMYDKLSRLSKTWSRDGNVVTNYTYFYKGTSSTNNYVESLTSFNWVAGSDLVQKGTRQYLDGLGRPMQELRRQHHPTKGADGAVFGAVDVITNFEYDNQGRLIKTTRPYSGYSNGTYYAPPGGTEFTLTQYESSPLNRVLSVTPPNGYATTTAYGKNANPITPPGTSITYAANTLFETKVTDPDNRVVFSYKDRKGRVILTRQTDTGGTSPAETYNVYDDKDRLEKVIPPGATLSSTDLIYSYEYSGDDLLLRKKIPGAAEVKMRYNNRDLLRLVQDGNQTSNARWYYTNYDDYGRPIKTARAISTNPNPDNATYTTDQHYTETFYDGYDGSTTLTAPQYMGKVRRMKNKVMGTILDLESLFTYDVYGRVISNYGNSVINTTAGSHLTSYTYDWADNVLHEELIHNPGSGASTGTQTIKHDRRYDHAGRLVNYFFHLNSQGQHLAEYNYNRFDELVERNHHANFTGGTWAWMQSTDYAYNNMGWLTRINSNSHTGSTLPFPSSGGCSPTLPAPGAVTRNYYPENNDLFYLELRYDQLFANNTAGGDIGGMTGTIQKAGNISQLAWRVRGRERQSYSFSYDHLSRLSSATYYDVNGSNTATNTNLFNESLTYDLRGNITSLQRKGYYASSCNFGDIDNLAYTYTPNTNQISSIADNAPFTQRNQGFNPGAGGSGYTYDLNGNLKTDSYKGITNINYNQFNLPTTITFSSGNSIEYKYDATGNKSYKTVKIGSTTQYEHYYLPGGIEYRKTGTGNTRIEAIYHGEGRYFNTNVDASDSPNWQKEYTLKDHLGNARVTFTDKNGNGMVDIPTDIVQENHYYPFGYNHEGNWRMNDAGRDHKYQYNYKELNDDFGLNWYDYGARWYMADIGRWGQVDPLADGTPGWTPYRYAFNNPLRMTDPNGMAERYYQDVWGTHNAATANIAGGLIATGNNPDDIIFLNSNNNELFRIEQEGAHEYYKVSGEDQFCIESIECPVNISFRPGVNQDVVSVESLNTLQEIGLESRVYNIDITSTARNASSQANAMYNNLIRNYDEQRAIYGPGGQQVIDAFDVARSQGLGRAATIELMTNTINEVGPGNVSSHAANPAELNVMDISQRNIPVSRYTPFMNAANSRDGVRMLNENRVFHIEIRQNN
jgi:RHS repeat-associated protein